MNDLYNSKAFLIQTQTRNTLDHENSSKKPINLDFVMHPTATNKSWISFNTTKPPLEPKTQATFGMSFLLAQKYRIKAKLYDFRSPKISLISTLPLLNNLKYYIKFSPRNEEQDTIFTIVGFNGEIDKFKITTAFLIQDNYYVLSKMLFRPWKGLFLKSFVNCDLSHLKVVDYAGMIGYEYKDLEVFFRQTFQAQDFNKSPGETSIALGCNYRYSSKLSFALWLRSTQNKSTSASQEKATVGGHYKIDERRRFKFKMADNYLYSLLYTQRFNDNLSFAVRYIDNIRKHDSIGNNIGISLKYQVY